QRLAVVDSKRRGVLAAQRLSASEQAREDQLADGCCCRLARASICRLVGGVNRAVVGLPQGVGRAKQRSGTPTITPSQRDLSEVECAIPEKHRIAELQPQRY